MEHRKPSRVARDSNLRLRRPAVHGLRGRLQSLQKRVLPMWRDVHYIQRVFRLRLFSRRCTRSFLRRCLLGLQVCHLSYSGRVTNPWPLTLRLAHQPGQACYANGPPCQEPGPACGRTGARVSPAFSALGRAREARGLEA